MKAIISSTYDDLYLFNLPIVTWCWNKLGVDVICFCPYHSDNKEAAKFNMMMETCWGQNLNVDIKPFNSPKHKEATYAQCSRLYAACLDLPEDEILVTSDVDMSVFKIPITEYIGRRISILGFDLVPDGQVPMCYAGGSVKGWRYTMSIAHKTYQQSLDDLLGGIDANHFRGNYWSKDQEELANKLFETKEYILIPRARPGTQFASNRIDRDDAYWEERLSPDIIDAHLWRPGYTDENFAKILKLLQYFYPNDGFDWLKDYREQYIKLL